MSFKLILDSKEFSLPHTFSQYTNIKDGVRESLISGKYEIQSKVSEAVFLSFLQYLDKSKEPDIFFDNFQQFTQLSKEFGVMQEIIEAKKEMWRRQEEEIKNLKQFRDSINNSLIEVSQRVDQSINLYESFRKQGFSYDAIRNEYTQLYSTLHKSIIDQQELIKDLNQNFANQLQSQKDSHEQLVYQQNEETKQQFNDQFKLVQSQIEEEQLKIKIEKKKIEEERERINEIQQQIMRDQKQMKEEQDRLNEIIKAQNEQIQSFASRLYQCCFFSDEMIRNCHFHIPIGQKWVVNSPCESLLRLENMTITVRASSVYRDKSDHQPLHLFNGRSDSDGGNQWATNEGCCNNSYIEIQFSVPVLVNVLMIAARFRYNDQAPGIVEIHAGTEKKNYEKLVTLTNLTWNRGQKRFFTFFNTKTYSYYKIQFNRTYDNSKSLGICELNVGEIENPF